MSASVCTCLSVCLSASIYPEPHAQYLPNFCAYCLSPCLGLPPAGWRNPKRNNFGGFLPNWQQCIVQHSIGDSYENDWTDRDAVLDEDSGGSTEP